MSNHVDADGDCPLAFVPCKYCDIGCKVKVQRTCVCRHCGADLLCVSQKYLFENCYHCLIICINVLDTT